MAKDHNLPKNNAGLASPCRILTLTLALAAASLLILQPAFSATDEKHTTTGGKEMEERMKQAYEEFMKKNPDAAKQKGNAKKKAGAKVVEDLEYKEMLTENAAYIKDLHRKAELSFKEESYRQAASFYASVVMSNVAKSDPLVDEARKKLLEMEDIAKQHLDNADDALLKRDQLQAIQELGLIVKEFPFAKVYKEAHQRLVSLKTDPTVAGLIEFTQAEAKEAAGELLEARKTYQSITENSRYDGSLAAMKAKRKVDEFDKDAAIQEKLKEELNALAAKEAPRLMASADNFLKNKMKGLAKEKLQAIVEKFPGTPYAEEAQMKINEIP